MEKFKVCHKKIRGLDISWIQEGSNSNGELIYFFLHGFPDDAHVWEQQIEFFSKRGLVIAPFLQGVGASQASGSQRRVSLESAVLDYLGILREVDRTNQSRVVVIGHDIGAFYAWEFARFLKKRLDSLVILNGLSIEQAGKRLTSLRQIAKSWYIALFLLPGLSNWLVSNWGRDLFVSLYSIRRPIPRGVSGMLNYYRRAFLEAVTRRSSRPDLIRSRVLIIWGLSDPFLLPLRGKEMENHSDRYTVRALEGDHWVFSSNSKRVNSLIDQFVHSERQLSRIEGTSGTAA